MSLYALICVGVLVVFVSHFSRFESRRMILHSVASIVCSYLYIVVVYSKSHSFKLKQLIYISINQSYNQQSQSIRYLLRWQKKAILPLQFFEFIFFLYFCGMRAIFSFQVFLSLACVVKYFSYRWKFWNEIFMMAFWMICYYFHIWISTGAKCNEERE